MGDCYEKDSYVVVVIVAVADCCGKRCVKRICINFAFRGEKGFQDSGRLLFPCGRKLRCRRCQKREHADSCRIHRSGAEGGFIPHSNPYALPEKLQGMHKCRFGRAEKECSPGTCRLDSECGRIRHHLFGLPDLVGSLADGDVHLFACC